MKKLLLTIPFLFLAAACNKQTAQVQPAQNQQSVAGTISSITIEPSTISSGWLMYKDGAVVKVIGTNLTSVEVRYWSTGTGIGQQYPDGQILGQAISLSSQQNTWSLNLPKGLMGTNLWAVAKDSNGKEIKSKDLGNFAYEESNGQITGWKTYTNPRVSYSFEYPTNNLKLDLDETIKYPSSHGSDAPNEDLVQFSTREFSYNVTTYVGAMKNFSSLADWLRDAVGVDSKISNYKKIYINNEIAYTHNGQLLTYVGFKGNVYIIAAYRGVSPSDVQNDSVYLSLVQSFKFTK